MDSIYTNGQTKVNNIVVHDPVSVQGANILTVNKEMDQRVLGDDKSGAAEMNKEAMMRLVREQQKNVSTGC